MRAFIFFSTNMIYTALSSIKEKRACHTNI